LCAAGEHKVVETEYLADVADPSYDPSTDSTNTSPLVGACGIGSAVSHRAPGRLVLYRVISVDPGTPTAFSVVLEHGNIRTLEARDTTLFGPPSEFKEAE
jgi:hypothetical protein